MNVREIIVSRVQDTIGKTRGKTDTKEAVETRREGEVGKEVHTNRHVGQRRVQGQNRKVPREGGTNCLRRRTERRKEVL